MKTKKQPNGIQVIRPHAWARFECIQPMYNLVKRQAEVELLPMALSELAGVISYSPLGGGGLTGKYATNKQPASGRLLENEMYKIRYGAGEAYAIAERFTQLAQDVDIHPVSLAIAWVDAHEGVTAPIIGARNTEQLAPALDSAKVDMPPALYQRISRLSPTPPLATDRHEESTGYGYNQSLSKR